eukprot:gene23311-29523_t
MLLIIEDDPGLQKQLRWSFDAYEVLVAGDREAALAQVRRHEPEVVITDLGLPPDPDGATEGLATLQQILALAPETKVVVLTGNQDHAHAVAAIGLGAYDFHQKPADPDLLGLVVQRAFYLHALQRENRRMQQAQVDSPLAGVISRDAGLQKICRSIEKVAPTSASVMLLGESGTGKELIARAIHDASERGERPLIRVNCAAIPRELFESEFFGHVRGAFTGALRDRIGRFELADRGTLFLDEVGEIPLELQSKLLRVLQEGQFERIGEERTRSVDVRIIAATNRDLKAAVRAGRFREDLFYRLDVMPIESVPLRERREDIPLLAVHFLEGARRKPAGAPLQLSEGDVRRLVAYPWPGNVRELQNVIERGIILARNGRLHIDLPDAAAPP